MFSMSPKPSPSWRRLIRILAGCLLILMGAAGLYGALKTGMFIGQCGVTEVGDGCVTYLSPRMTAVVSTLVMLGGAGLIARLRSWRDAALALGIVISLAACFYALSAFQECVVNTDPPPCENSPYAGACAPPPDCSPQPIAYLGFIVPVGLMFVAYSQGRQSRKSS